MVIILAAGPMNRWTGPTPKHLVVVDGEPLLHRTCRKVAALGFSAERIVIAVCEERPYRIDGPTRFIPRDRSSTRATLLSVMSVFLSSDPNRYLTVLLGDVFYTDEAIASILSFDPKDSVAVFMDGGEIFAVRFSRMQEEAVRDALLRAELRGDNNGRLWNAFLHIHAKVDRVLISDRTQDFDTVDEYLDFLRGKSKNALLSQKR